MSQDIQKLQDRIARGEKDLKRFRWREQELLGEHSELRDDIQHLEVQLPKLRRELQVLEDLAEGLDGGAQLTFRVLV